MKSGISHPFPAQAEAARRAHGSLASPWWTRYRRAVVDSLHGLAEKCDLDLSVAHHAVRLIDLLWLLPNARDDALRWVARTMREHAAYLCVAALRASARLHRAPVPDDGAFARHVPDLFSKQCQNSDWRTCERYIDLHLGWRVLCVTPLHCLQHFIALKPLYARAAVWKPTTGSGGPDQTSQFSRSVKSKSIRLIFGRIDCSRRVLEAQPKRLRRNCRVRAH